MDSDLVQNLISVIALIILLLFGVFFSGAEMAFSSLNRARIKNMAESGGKRGRRANIVADLYENRFDEVISTLLTCNNLVAITSATVSVSLFVRLLGEWGYIVSTVLISAIVIVFTDIFPKSISKQQPEKIAIACAPIIKFLMVILKPVNWVIAKIKNSISAPFATKEEDNGEDEQALRGQELIFMVEEAEKDGAINEDESLLITNAIEFDDITAGDIITPRVDILSIPHDASIDDVAVMFLESGYSRMPVYEDSLDNIKGVIHLRDFLRCMAKSNDEKPLTLADITTPAIYTVPSAKIAELLQLLKKERSHIAIVTDEYGGTEGIVTMDDILERLVGDIWDEHDEIIEEFVPLGDNKYKILCTAYIDDMFEFFEMKAESEANTVGGWIMDELRRIPEEGDSFTFEKLNVTITKSDQRRPEECLVEVIHSNELINDVV